MKRIFSLTACVVIAGLLLAACASGSVTVTQPLTQRTIVSAIRIASVDSTVTVPPEIASAFEGRLSQYLYEGGPGRFVAGDEMILAYRFIQYNPGNRAARYFIGFGAGKGTLTVEVVFRSPSGAELAKVNVGGELTAGVFGGDIDEAVNQAAKQAAEFANNNFARPVVAVR